MEFQTHGKEHIIILGAGASVEYGLPVWLELSSLIIKKIDNDSTQKYKYKGEIKAWLEKIGEGKEYMTLDECIQKESVTKKYHDNGEEIENEIFLILKEIFKERYVDLEDGWINSLNNKILHQKIKNLEEKLTFISYNYDDVLDKNFLNFAYLPSKYRRINHKPELDRLSSVSTKTLYAHGNLFPEDEFEYNSNLDRRIETIKTADPDFIDAVSCYESKGHIVSGYRDSKIKLYILELGGGLKINLGNIYFQPQVVELHVTIRDEKNKKDILSFLSEKYSIPESEINVYSSCKDLIESNFFEDDF